MDQKASVGGLWNQTIRLAAQGARRWRLASRTAGPTK